VTPGRRSCRHRRIRPLTIPYPKMGILPGARERGQGNKGTISLGSASTAPAPPTDDPTFIVDMFAENTNRRFRPTHKV